MAKYQPNIPTGTVKLDQDYKNLRSNFQQINTVFGTDHTTMDDTTANLGYHKTIHIIPRNPDNDPNTVDGIGQLYSRIVNDNYDTDTILYFKTGFQPAMGKKIQMTSNFVPAVSGSSKTAGRSFMMGGLVVQWGFVSGTNGGNFHFNNSDTGTVTFPNAFGTAIYGITINLSYNTNTGSTPGSSGSVAYDTSTISLTKFDWVFNSASSSYTNFMWIAIGK